jgi:hypothetical protein
MKKQISLHASRWTILLLALLFFTWNPSISSADSIDILASADAYIRYLKYVDFNVYDTASIVMTNSGGNNLKHGYFEFDLTSLPDDIVITSASFLIMTSGLISNSGDTATMYLSGYSGDGSITLADWSLPVTSMGSETYAAGTSGTPINTSLTNDLTTLTPLLDSMTSGDQYFGIRTSVSFGTTMSVHSLESTYASAVLPTLRINYESQESTIPEPTTLLLFGPAMGWLAWRRRKAAGKQA